MMKRQRIVLAVCCLFYVVLCFPNILLSRDVNTKGASDNRLFELNSIYSYRHFRFNSVRLPNLQRYYGYASQYTLGANQFRIKKDITGGLAFFHMDSHVNTAAIILPAPLIRTAQQIRSDFVFGHVLIPIKPKSPIAIDLIGGYGQSKTNSYSIISSARQQFVHGNSSSEDWFVSVAALYTNTWKNFIYKGAFSVLHNELDQKRFTAISNLRSITILPLTNIVTDLIEGVEVGYKLNDKIVPFIDGSLIQVVQFSNSRPLVTGVLIGTLPELSLDQNGYQVGGGIGFNFKPVILRVEQLYIHRGNPYRSHLSRVTLKIAIG